MAHGEVDEVDARHARAADLVVAADGGSAHLARWGIAPHVVVGDLDSLEPGTGPFPGARVERWPREKDKSDTELAVERAVAGGADEIVILGALGGPRADHAIANTLLLALERRAGVDVRVVRGALSIRLVRGGQRAALTGNDGDLVTLLAVGGDARDVRTEGLRYALAGETLRLGSSRGLSNEVHGGPASVSVGSGALLVIEDGAVTPPEQPETKP